MKRIALLLAAFAMMAGVVVGLAHTSTRTDDGPAPPSAAEPAPQSAKQVRGATPYIEIKNEPAPKLIVDEALPDGLPLGIGWIQYRTENCRIVPVFGKEALNVSPRAATYMCRSTTCLGCGPTQATTTRSTSAGCHRASTK